MKLLLIRHGQTDWNTQGKIQGSYDTELNAIGISQAYQLSDKIKEMNNQISKIYSSPQKRALKTAEIISQELNIPYQPIAGLEEINLGQWEGLTWPEVKAKYPTEYDEWYNNRRYTTPPHGESYQDMLDRVLRSIHKIINETPNETTLLLVTHSAIIMCLQCLITNTPFKEMSKFKTENTSITEIDSDQFSSSK